MKKARKRTTRKKAPKVNPMMAVKVKDFWYESTCRADSRHTVTEGGIASPAFTTVLFDIMVAKRDARRMSEAEGGPKPGKIYKTHGLAVDALKAMLAEAGLKLSSKAENAPPGAKEFARALRAAHDPARRIFDLRHPAELKKDA